ncbi:glycosyl hydrolase [Phycisphaerales bacterium AB-hyl4]|uniref:Glycosyl hydrolase n=1 Tax=Natronomicrosphaera hydrolytica TaxID=3242702 RepID=A0ABV4U560_9BACT
MNTLSQEASQFKGFPKQFSFAPLWFWNDEMYEEEILRQLKEMKAQHVNETMIWCNAGMNQRYLSEDYFALFVFAVEQAKKLGMRVWIYDDWSWPSGLAGGIINEVHPEYLMTACRMYRYDVSADGPRELVQRLPLGRVVRAEAERVSDGKRIDLDTYCDDTSLRWTAPSGAWRVYVAVVTKLQKILDPTCSSRWGNWLPGYLDVMNRDAVAKFIELCYEAHYQRVSEHFGNTIRGYFTDEPGIRYDHDIFGGGDHLALHRVGFPWKDEPREHAHANLHGVCGSVPWTADLFHHFRERRGYDLRPHLIDLLRAGDEQRKVCYDYYSLVSDLFAESWCEQIGQWCGERKVAYTGHYCEGVNGGDYYRQVKPQQVPGMDILGDHGVQMKDLMALPRKIASIGRMQNRDRILSETYSDTSWDFNLHDKIRDADLLTVLGINIHASIDYTYSFRSIRKHTTNPAGFFQASNWNYNKHFADHVTRLCQMTCAGESSVDTAIVYGSHAALSDALIDHVANDQLEKATDKAFRMLMAAQIESDIIYDTGLPDGKVEAGELVYPKARYKTLLLANLPFMRKEHAELLVDFVRTGGELVVLSRFPLRAPDGEDITAVWQQLADPGRIDTAREIERLDMGKGRLTLVPDFMRDVTSSDAPRTGDAEALFDGTNSMVVYPRSPQWIAIDFREPLELTRFSMTIEGIKKHIEYAYTLEVSDDGRSWKPIADIRRIDEVHREPLNNVKTRYFRLHVTEAGGRYLSLHDLSLHYRTADGQEKRWAPAGCDPLLMQQVLPSHQPRLELLGKDGKRVRSFTTAWRSVDGDDLVAIANRHGEEQLVTARLNDDKVTVEAWDLDSGERTVVPVDHGAFQVTFAPYESHLFMLRRKSTDSLPVRPMNRERVALTESQGPWPFKPLRQNAYPFVAAGLEMCDPAHPDKWYPTEDGSIPKPLRLIPAAQFRCTVPIESITGDERLLFEEGLIDKLKINGQPVTEAGSRDRYLDAFGLSTPIGDLLVKGDNVFTGLFQPEMYERLMEGTWYHYDNIQPTLDAFILGDFAVRDDALVAAPASLDSKAWEHQGFKYFSGTAAYTVAFDVPGEVQGPLWLEADVRENVLEVFKDGQSLGVRVTYPFVIDVTAHIAPGRNVFELHVTNPVGSLLSAQKRHSWKGRIDLNFMSGLRSARLVQPRDERFSQWAEPQLAGTRRQGDGGK